MRKKRICVCNEPMFCLLLFPWKSLEVTVTIRNPKQPRMILCPSSFQMSCWQLMNNKPNKTHTHTHHYDLALSVHLTSFFFSALLFVKAFDHSHRNQMKAIVQNYIRIPFSSYRKCFLFIIVVHNEFSGNLVTQAFIRNEMRLKCPARSAHQFRNSHHQSKA